MNSELQLSFDQSLWHLKSPLNTSHGSISERASLSLRVQSESDDATVGLGEAAPLPGWSSETLDEVIQQLSSIETALPRFDPSDAAAFDSWLDHEQIRSTSLRFGLACAAMDFEAQVQQKSWGAMLGEDVSAALPVALLCSSRDVATRAYQTGARTLKLKAGMELDAETQLLRDVLAEGSDLRLRIDVNQGWSIDEALSTWEHWSFAHQAIEFIEEPLRTEDSHHWETLMRVGMPLAFDESVRSERDLDALVSRELSGVIVLKPSLIGTPNEVLRLARKAKRSGFDVMVSNLIETSVTRLYCAHIAGLIRPVMAAGLGTGDLFECDWGKLKVEEDAVIELSRYRTSRECML